MAKPLLKETPDAFILAKIGTDGVPRELQARWISDTLIGLTVFVATWHCTIPLDRAEAQQFANWLSGQVDQRLVGRGRATQAVQGRV